MPIALPALLPSEATPAESASGRDDNLAVHVSSALSDAPQVDRKRSILVKYGDTLENLALQHLGSRTALNILINANPQITDINRIYPGQKVYLSAVSDLAGRPSAADRIASRPQPSYANDALRSDTSNSLETTSRDR